MLLVGEGGVGKSRLAREVIRFGADRGFSIFRTIATRAASTVPLGALAPLLPPDRPPGTDVVGWVPQLVSRLAAHGRSMVLVDDAHLLDEYAAGVLVDLALGVSTFLVVTARTGEPMPEGLLTLWKEGLVDRIEVPPLDLESTVAIAARALGADLDPRLSTVIGERSRGNPLVAQELALSGLETGTVRFSDGRWHLEGDLAPSSRLIELISARMGAVDDREREALELIAFGEPLEAGLLEHLGFGPSLEALERRGRLVATTDGRRRQLWLAHPIQADVVRTAAGRLGAARHSSTLASAIEHAGMRRRGDLLRVASLRLDSGEDVDPALLKAAADETRAMLDMAATARLARAAWDRTPDVGSGLATGAALAFLGHSEEAEAMLAVAADLATTPMEAAIATVHRSFVLANGMGLPEEASQVLDLIGESATADPEARDLLAAQRAALDARDRSPTGKILQAAGPLADHRSLPVRVLARYALVVAMVNRGSYRAAADLVTASIPDHREAWRHGLVPIPDEVLAHHADLARFAMGRLEGWDHADPATVRFLTPGRRTQERLRAILAARAAVVRGRPETTRSILVPFLEADDRPDRQVLALLVMTAAVKSDLGAVRRLVATMERAAVGTRPFDSLLDQARAWALSALGHPEEARRRLRQAIEGSFQREEWGMARAMIRDLAILGDVGGAAALLDRVDAPVDGDLGRIWEAHVRAWAAGEPGGLDLASAEYEALGADLPSAEAAAVAARLWMRVGDVRSARRARTRAHVLLARCEGARTPPLLDLDGATPLTDREREVADLAARGLPAKEIGERLFISSRTVENHLHHVYEKLGVASRDELRDALLTWVG